MGLILCVSEEQSKIRRICSEHQLITIEWPEIGIYGKSVGRFLESKCPRNLDAIDLVVCENLSSSPVIFYLRKAGYKGPLILIPHINSYPFVEFLHALQYANIWRSNDI